MCNNWSLGIHRLLLPRFEVSRGTIRTPPPVMNRQRHGVGPGILSPGMSPATGPVTARERADRFRWHQTASRHQTRLYIGTGPTHRTLPLCPWLGNFKFRFRFRFRPGFSPRLCLFQLFHPLQHLHQRSPHTINQTLQATDPDGSVGGESVENRHVQFPPLRLLDQVRGILLEQKTDSLKQVFQPHFGPSPGQ